MTDAIQPAAPVKLTPEQRQAAAVVALRGELVTRIAPYIEAERADWLTARALSDAVSVTDAASLKDATEWRQAWTQLLDKLEAVRAAGPGDVGRVVRESNALFKSLRDLGEAAKANLDAEIGGYAQRQKQQREAAYTAAVAAHAAGENTAAAEALAVASATDTALPQGTNVREVWEVDRYDHKIMVLSTDDCPGLVPDEKAIAAYLRKCPIDVEPALPGVICKRVAKTMQRRAKGEAEE